MSITSIPSKSPGSLGTALVDVTAPEDNQLAAVDYEHLKSRVIEIFEEVGLSDGSTAGSINEALDAVDGAITDSDLAGTHTGRLQRTGVGSYAVIKDTATASAPTVDDDTSEGYSVGSQWVDTSTENLYQCVNASVGAASWDPLNAVGGGGGSGDVEGPASSTDNAIARFHLATGKVIQNSVVTIDDSGNIATAGTVDGRDLSVDGAKLDLIEALADVTDATNVAAAGAVMDSDFAGSHTGRMQRTGAGAYAVVKDVVGTSMPTASDDNTQGYAVGSKWIDTISKSIYECTDASTGAAVWPRVDNHIVAPRTESGTSITLADTDHGVPIRCTAATTVTVSVPSGLTPGVTVELIQEGDGQIQLQGTGSPALTLRYPASFAPNTNEKYSTLVVTITASDEAVVRGDMAAA